MMRPDSEELRRVFSRHAEKKRSHEFERSEKRLRREDVSKLEDAEEFMTIALAAIEATAESIAAFEVKLTKYEALTVEEIMHLQKRIDSLLAEREALLENAYVLPDGRRVFKTEDGKRVFDEHGVQVLRTEIDPNTIDNAKPRWERFDENETALQISNDQLNKALEFQSELDDMRERLNKEGLTTGELKELEHRLERSVPASIRIRQTAIKADGEPVKVTPDFAVAASGQINLDTLKIDSPGLTG